MDTQSQEFITKITELVSIPSAVNNNKALHDAVDYVANVIDDGAVTIERFTSNNIPSFLAYYGSRPEQFDLILNGHVDVVPGKPEQFKPYVEGDKLFGRGVYDMKAATLVMAEIFRTYAQKSPLTIGFQVVADEETGGMDGVKYQLSQGVKADFVVIGEMTDNGICTETRGLCWVDIGFKGTVAHSGYVWHGDNALVKATNLASAILQKYPVPKKQEWRTTANIAAIATPNTTYNKVPDEATLKVDFRFIPEDPVFKTEEGVREFIASLAPDADVSFDIYGPAVLVPKTNAYLQSFIKAYEQATQKESTLIQRFASSDARFYAGIGVDCIEFGPAGKHLHANDEYLDIPSLAPFAQTLITFIRNKP